MDPITQGALGAVASQNLSKKRFFTIACVLGVLSGMAPDLDVFIRSDTDPLLFLYYHRQFTHALIFIPVGGLLCALVLHFLFAKRWSLRFRETLLFCTAGYATHALLDACTSYGTQLFWPFTDYRVAWNVVSVIDPLFTLPLLVLIALAVIKKQVRYVRIAVVWIVVFMSAGLLQRERAETVGGELAAARGHELIQLEAKPTFANLIVWKTIYQTKDRYYVDGVRLGSDIRIIEGTSVPKLDISRDLPWLDKNSQQARDIERFRWFSDGYIALHPQRPQHIIDVRYSMLPHQIQPLWMIQVDESAAKDQYAEFIHDNRNNKAAAPELLKMIWNF